MKKTFILESRWKPAGDQPQAIEALTKGLESGMHYQTLLGVTGSGKTFTAANVIANRGMPTLVIAHNKTLAAQLAQEYKEFFPHNEVHYFVSYYDYYIPEAYIPHTDTYIEKDAAINKEIDRLRHASTQALLTRRDVIIIASVSCIYGLGSPEEYLRYNLELTIGEKMTRRELIKKLVGVYFERTTADLMPGKFRALGNAIEVVSASEKVIFRIAMSGGVITHIQKIDFMTRTVLDEPLKMVLFPAKHFVTPDDARKKAIVTIKLELEQHLKDLEKNEGAVIEIERIKRRTKYDLAMINEVGYVKGIENYSRHFSGKKVGDPPDTLLSYFPYKDDGTPDFLTIIDESHVTVPQINGMHAGDASRKRMLIKHGFRLPSALDNRPLTYPEFEARTGQVIYTSATPGPREFEQAKDNGQVVEQIIRPTGLIDPSIEVRPIIGEKGSEYGGQVEDMIREVEKTTKEGDRSIATTLTKKMSEDLSEFLKERGIKAKYLHSEIKTLERIEILTDFRKGEFDCLVGVNLLREGLDLPEVTFIGILDADKEGFLRSETSLIQTIGRAARNVKGRVILYADKITGSMERAMKETDRRREIQIAYNKKHNITPTTISKSINDITEQLQSSHQKTVQEILEIDKERLKKAPKKLIKEKEKQMIDAVKVLDFETAAILRDEIVQLKKIAGIE